MRASHPLLVASLSWWVRVATAQSATEDDPRACEFFSFFLNFNIINHQLPPGSILTDDKNKNTAMTDPASRTYPTTITTNFTTTHMNNQTGNFTTATIDVVTLIDPWPVSPDPESPPYTVTQTAHTQRTILISPSYPTSSSPSIPSSTTTNITTTRVWTLWTIQAFDLPPYDTPACPGPGGCSYPAIKPHPRCAERKLETRCAAQCLLRDWMWWCAGRVDGEPEYMGRVCAASNSTGPWDGDGDQLLEPCDHTDFKPGCSICEGYREDEPWVGLEPEGFLD